MKSIDTWILHNVIHILLGILLLMTVLRLGITYTHPTGHLTMPELSFAYGYLGRDFDDYTMRPVYEIRKGITPYIFGYGSVFIAEISSRIAETVGLCDETNSEQCGTLLYGVMILFGIASCIFLLFASIHDRKEQTIALMFFITFLLGVPANKAMEAGNIDIVLAPLTGILLLYLDSIFKKSGSHTIQHIALGILAGLMLNSKAFLLPFILLTFIATKANFLTVTSFVISFTISALWPWIYGVHPGLLDVFTFAIRGSTYMNSGITTQINYGNNSLIPYVSGIIKTLISNHISDFLQNILTWILCIPLCYLLFVKPWIDEKISYTVNSLCSLSFPYILVLFTLSYSVILTLPTWSYDYRIYYGVPMLFFLIAKARHPISRQLVYTALIFLLIKSLWFPKERIMTIFLYMHVYFVQRAALSIWKHDRLGNFASA